MPVYEMPLLLRIMPKSEIVSTLKRTAQVIFDQGGLIRKIDNLGVKQLPCKASAHGQVHRTANYFIFYFDVPPQSLSYISSEYTRDMDIVRTRIFRQNEPSDEPCTHHEENLPPPYRPEVKKLIEIAKSQENTKYKFKYNSGLNYYPFQR